MPCSPPAAAARTAGSRPTLPSAAFAALLIVLVLEQSSGQIEFSSLGFAFKGASGQIVLWAFARSSCLETEVAAYLEAHRDERDREGHAQVVRNGKGRTRKVTVGVGT